MPELNEEVTLRIPRLTCYLGVVRRAVVQMARRAGFEREDIGKIEMAVDEACTNAVCHSGTQGVGEIEVRLAIDERGIRVNLFDFGRPFTFEAKVDSLDDYLDRREPGGLGTYIIRRFMDEVEVRHAPATGNEIRLTKFRS